MFVSFFQTDLQAFRAGLRLRLLAVKRRSCFGCNFESLEEEVQRQAHQRVFKYAHALAGTP